MNKLKIIFKVIFTILFFQLNSCGLKVVENHGQIYEKNVDFKLPILKTRLKDMIQHKLVFVS